MEFYLLQVIAYIFFIPMFLAIYAALRRFNESYVTLAMIFAFVGIAIFLATNNSFSMLSLSNQYAAATTEMQKSMILAAGQTIMINTGQRAVGGFNMGLFFLSMAGILVSYVMLKSNIFSKTTAYVGILTFIVSLADFFRIVFLPSIFTLLLIMVLIFGLFLLIWLILVGRRLFQLGQENERNQKY
jgi:hypothetical protein